MDFILSYWIFAWFVLYYIGIIQTPPLLLLWIGLTANLGELIYLIYLKVAFYNLSKFIIINTCLKIIPLFLIGNQKITLYEIKASVVFVLTYLIWIVVNGVSILDYYKQFLNNYRFENGKKTLLSDSYDRLYKFITDRL